MRINAAIFGIQNLTEGFEVVERNVQRGGRKGMRRAVRRGRDLVRANAQGRPGPRRITGQYWRSIQGKIIDEDRLFIRGAIGTDEIRARRLEFGFFGPDRIGRPRDPANRPYSRPFPHFQPALGDIAQAATEEVFEAINAELSER